MDLAGHKVDAGQQADGSEALIFMIAGEGRMHEGGIARDDERAADAREIGGQAFGDAVDEICCSGSPPTLANGNTTMDRRRGAFLSAACGVAGAIA
jgi:hypothetical protein